jgi:hypothetical protein
MAKVRGLEKIRFMSVPLLLIVLAVAMAKINLQAPNTFACILCLLRRKMRIKLPESFPVLFRMSNGRTNERRGAGDEGFSGI